VQRAFFPQGDLSIPGLSCETFYEPAHSIGGDYYDFLPLQRDCWGIAIGDVFGKGIGAALLMASLHASLRAQAMHDHSDLRSLRLLIASSRMQVDFQTLLAKKPFDCAGPLQYVRVS
jgi:sigma-B regulation protein RsbU (phosphoserine phosphatase)